MKIKNLFFVAVAALFTTFVACEKNPGEKEPSGGAGNVLLTTILPNPGGMTGASYMQLIDIKEGTQQIDNKEAIPIAYSGSYPLVIGSDVYVFPSYIGDTKPELRKYTRSNNKLVKAGALSLPANSNANSVVVVSAQKAYVGLAGLGMIYVFNPSTMTKTGEIDLTSLGIEDKNPDVAIMIERDGILFVGLSQMVNGWTSPETYTQADMAVIDTKTDKLVKMISEKTAGFSQATRPIDPKSLFMDEKGDIYVSCLGNFGEAAGHKAGVLRIKKGETDFDPGYRWTITGAEIKNEPQKAGFISSLSYVGNGKAYGYINIPGYYKKGEKGHSAIADRAVEIDIYKQTMKKVEGLDLSNGYGILVSNYKNGLAISNASTTAKGIYFLNPTTGTVNPQPMILTVGNPMSFHWFEN